jgi:hypothetical protein
MTPQKKLYLAIIVLVTLAVLRETGILNLNYYTTKVNTNAQVKWFSSARTRVAQYSKPVANHKNNDLSIVILLDNDTIYKEINKLPPVLMKLHSSYGRPLWRPLYKSADFAAYGSMSSGDANKKLTSLEYASKSHLFGELTINGNITVSGFCSHRQAVQAVKNVIASKAVDELKKYLSSVQPEYIADL